MCVQDLNNKKINYLMTNSSLMALSFAISCYCLAIMNNIQNMYLPLTYSMLVCEGHRLIECSYLKDLWSGTIVQTKWLLGSEK